MRKIFVMSMILVGLSVSLFSQMQLPDANKALNDAKTQAAKVNVGDEATKAAVSEFKKVAQDIPFDYKSSVLALSDPKYSIGGYDIDAFMKKVLIPALAKLISVLPVDKKIVIEGHASAVGTDDVNQPLSRARADALLEYLKKNSTLDTSKFKIKASSTSKPKAGTDPADVKNCRVSFDIE